MTMLLRLGACLCAATVFAAGCGDDGAPEATPEQADALATLIDAELTGAEQTCLLQGLVDTEIDPGDVVADQLSADDDAELLAVTVECVDDLAAVPGFVESFIEGAAEGGVVMSDEQARCAIDTLGEVDPTEAIAMCLASSAPDDDDSELLSLLAEACTNGNNLACDELYDLSPIGTAEEELGRTCAGQLPDSVGLRCSIDLDGS